MSEDYIPYGPEWKKEMAKFRKEKIIEMLASKGMEAEDWHTRLTNAVGERFMMLGKIKELETKVEIDKELSELRLRAGKLKELMIEVYEKIGDRKCLVKNNREWTGTELAEEIKQGSEMGRDVIRSIIGLTIDLLSRGKISLPPETSTTEGGMRKHELKTYPEYFKAVLSGEKDFELRKNDRNFKVGDTLILKEYNPPHKEDLYGEYTGREIKKTIKYILVAFSGLNYEYCILGLNP